ncbi:MAG: DNA cytosine methyltransferase [Bacteroidales bacterium]|nr:DNA cytosine methyltransferase [Bacteroidales bacterium]
MKFIDIFAGASGLSEGFIRAGFEPVGHIEMDKNACMTIKTRMAYHYLKKNKNLNLYIDYLNGLISREQLYNFISDDLINKKVINEELSNDSISKVIKIIEGNLKYLNCNSIDVVVGGPPCQSYSLVGRARDYSKMKTDPRNYLYKLYARILKAFGPEIFVFENVTGIISAQNGNIFQDLKYKLDEIGYSIEYKLLNAAHFGVLQNRKRVILIGWKKGKDLKFPEFDNVQHRWNVNDMFQDLPELKAGEIMKTGQYSANPCEYTTQYGIRNGIDILTQHITRPHNQNDLAIYKIAIQLWNKEKRRLKYPDIPEQYKTHKNVSSFLDRFKVVDGDGISHTMVAHISKDGHYYIHPDINQLRSISVREAARIQSFPDNYYFEGPRTSIFQQIGNAVPPLMAEKIAKKIKEMLN